MNTEAAAPGQTPAVRAGRGLRRLWMTPRGEIFLFGILTLVIRLAAWQLRPAILPDTVDLFDAADRVAEGGSVLAAQHHPLPVWVLSWLEGLGRDPEPAASVLVAALAAIGVWPLHVLTRSACGRHGATITCLLYAVLPKFVLIGSVPLAEGLFVPLFLGAFAAAATAHIGPSAWKRGARLFVAGALAGGAYLCRPEGLAAGIAVPVLAWAQARRGGQAKIVSLGIPLAMFLLVALPWVAALSADRGMLALSPKKDVGRFLGVSDAPQDGGTVSAVAGAARAMWGALGPVLLVVVAGALPHGRWGPRHRRVRLLLLLTAAALFVLLVRLRSGWGYAGGRHALAASCLLLPFAGEGAMTLVSVLSRRTGRRRAAAILLTMLAAIPLAVHAILRPDGEGGERERHLGRAIARASADAGDEVLIASFREPLVAYYADRELRPRRARNVRLLRDHDRLLKVSADLADARAALAKALRDSGARWLVLDLYSKTREQPGVPPRAAGSDLAMRLLEDGVIGTPVVASGSELAAFPVLPSTK